MLCIQCPPKLAVWKLLAAEPGAWREEEDVRGDGGDGMLLWWWPWWVGWYGFDDSQESGRVAVIEVKGRRSWCMSEHVGHGALSHEPGPA